jgi:flagellar M-ring protein FliF
MADEIAATQTVPAFQLPKVREALDRLTPRQKAVGLAAIAMVIALVVGGVLWNKEPAYAVLFSVADEKDAGVIVDSLKQQNIPYRYSEGGKSILVPQGMVYDTRLKLATMGLPKGGLVGFELMENAKLGQSQFAEQINYQRGLEGELARSIQSLSAVKAARVHLAMPKQTAFLRDAQKVSASVLVSLHPGRSLEVPQVKGIVNLVASSVPQLDPANVSIVDQDGKLMSKEDPLKEAGLDPVQLRYVRDIESHLVKRVEAILTPVTGASNVRAEVTAEVDFAQVDQVAEMYKPNPNPDSAIRSQQTGESGNNLPGPAGVPGALTNQPPVPATAPITTPQAPGSTTLTTNANGTMTYSRNATTNYEVDKTIRHSKGSPGSVRRLSVAVVVNHKKEVNAKDPTKSKQVPFTDVEMKQITDLAREAMGYNKDRGDSLSVANAPFTAPEKEVIESAPIITNAELFELGKEAIKYLAIAGVLFFLWRSMLQPVFEQLLPPPPPPPPIDELPEEDIVDEAPEEPTVDFKDTYEGKLAAMRDLARSDYKAVATLMEAWINGTE